MYQLELIRSRIARYRYGQQMAILYNQMGTPNPKYQIDVAEHHYIEDCSWLLKQISILDECLECACANFKLEQQIRFELEKKLAGIQIC